MVLFDVNTDRFVVLLSLKFVVTVMQVVYMLQGTIKARSEMEPTVVAAVIMDSWSRIRAT